MQQSPKGTEPAASTTRSQTLSGEFLLSEVSVPKKERRLPRWKCHRLLLHDLPAGDALPEARRLPPSV